MTSDRAPATVIIVTYNHATTIGECLDAVRATTRPDDQIVVVDNASSDATRDILRERYAWADVITSARNDGFGAACNRGALIARHDALVFLNPDTRPRAGWLDALIETLEAYNGEALVTARLLLARNPTAIDTFGNEFHISGLATSRYWGQPSGRATSCDEVAAISGACFGLTRSVFARLDGFDARLFLYYEDTDLSLRARYAGLRCLAVAGADVLHDHQPGFSPAKLRYLERNRYWTMLKLCRARSLVALLPVLLVSETLAWSFAIRGGSAHVVAKARAWLELATWMPGLPHARARARRDQEVSDRALWQRHAIRLPIAQVNESGTIETVVACVFSVAWRLTTLIGLHDHAARSR